MPSEVLDNYEKDISEAETLLEVFDIMKVMFEDLMTHLDQIRPYTCFDTAQTIMSLRLSRKVTWSTFCRITNRRPTLILRSNKKCRLCLMNSKINLRGWKRILKRAILLEKYDLITAETRGTNQRIANKESTALPK